jgi:hypothetical protein
MTRNRFFAFVFAAMLFPAAAGAQPPAKPHPSPDPDSNKIKGDCSFRLTPVVSFAPWYDGIEPSTTPARSTHCSCWLPPVIVR